MAADWTPGDLPLADSPGEPQGTERPRSLRGVLLVALLVLGGMWGLGASGLIGDVQEVVAHVFPGLAGGCGGG